MENLTRRFYEGLVLRQLSYVLKCHGVGGSGLVYHSCGNEVLEKELVPWENGKGGLGDKLEQKCTEQNL